MICEQSSTRAWSSAQSCFPGPSPRQAFDAAVACGRVLVSVETVAELDEVLRRPKFNRYVSQGRRLEFLAALVREAEAVEGVDVVAVCRDVNDNKFLALTLSGRATHIVTGDSDLHVLDPFHGIHIVPPRSFPAETAVDEG